MDSLLILIPMTILLVFAVIGFFVLSVKSGQYDDMEGPAHRILMDDDDPMIPAYKPEVKGAEDLNSEVDSVVGSDIT